ncbi:MAG TPA: helix-turn-helix domain-containing protein [Puia sp.]|nr:helix-turn-helix domain-containing protein [Puia sp.]
MKNITILVPETAVTACIVDPRYMFTAVNTFLRNANKPPQFKIQLAGLSKNIEVNEGTISINTDTHIKDIRKTDLIIIPAISGDIKAALKLNKEFIPWIIQQYKNGAEVASLCIGAFLLASTGLLDGKTCSTHWLHVDEFKKMFPAVNVADEKIITIQNSLYTSGGATAYWSLLLYLVEKYTSREMAILASKFFLLDINRNTQSPFIIFRGQKEHDDCEILRAQEFIEHHYQDKITIDLLSDKFGMVRRTFERRFKKATNNTVVEYMQRVKTEAAKKQLEHGRKTVNEVMYDIGYNDAKAFRDVFKKITGMSPVDYRNKYNKMAMA